MDSIAEKLFHVVHAHGLVRPKDLVPLGIPRVALTRAVRRGQLERVGRGLYGFAGRPVSAHGTLAEVARRVPRGVICLLSALRFHELTTQAPFEVWLAIDNKAAAPKIDYPPLRLVRFSGAALTGGVEEHVVDGVTIRVTSVAKTVARLLNRARAEQLDFNLLLTRYAMERMLYRLSVSEQRAQFLLKGALLFRTQSMPPRFARRPTTQACASRCRPFWMVRVARCRSILALATPSCPGLKMHGTQSSFPKCRSRNCGSIRATPWLLKSWKPWRRWAFSTVG